MPTEISFQKDLSGKNIWEKQLYKLNKIFKKQEVKGQDTQPGYLDSIPISIHELCNKGHHSVYMSMSSPGNGNDKRPGFTGLWK